MPDRDDPVERTMKPMFAALVKEAVKLALIDCVVHEAARAEWEEAGGPFSVYEAAYDRMRTEWEHDVYAIPDRLFAGMDPMALAQNVCVRLLGPGGWVVGNTYAGNATAREMFDETFSRPDQSHVDEVAFDVMRGMAEGEVDGAA